MASSRSPEPLGEVEEHPAVTRFRQYLRIQTVSGRDSKPDYAGATRFIQSLAADFDFPCDIIELSSELLAVVITWTGTKPDLSSIMLYSHMDVVPVYSESWSHDPFAAVKLDNGDIVARGSQDMKSVGMQYVEAARCLKQAGVRLSRTIHIVFGPDEETTGEGMKKFLKHPKFMSMNVGFCLDEGLPNPTDSFSFFYGERAIWAVTVKCTGNPGHGSRLIDNTAAEKMMNIINRFMDYRKQQVDKLKSGNLSLGDVSSVNLTILQGGVQVNVVPEELIAGNQPVIIYLRDTSAVYK